jgi:hypothetical protein
MISYNADYLGRNKMKMHAWTTALAATGVVSLASAVLADESHPVNTLLTSTTLSGFVDTSAIWQFNTGGGVAQRFVNTAQSRQDGFNLNLAKIQIEKPVDEGTWSAGYDLETVFGPDAVALPGNLANNLALEQAYVALRAPVGNGLDLKVGVYNPIIGYESTDSYANPNFSHSFGFALEPRGHLGVLATYQFTESIGAAFGVANTGQYGLFSKANGNNIIESQKSYTAALTLKAPESWGWLAGSSLYAGAVDGGHTSLVPTTVQSAVYTGGNAINLYVGASIATPIKELSLGGSYDYLFDGYNTFKGSYANATAVYASYQITKEIKLNNRAEYATSSGIDLAGNMGFNYFPNAMTPDTHLPALVNDQKLFGETLTVDYQLWTSVITRAEFRWDHDTANSHGLGGRNDDLSITANVIYKF